MKAWSRPVNKSGPVNGSKLVLSLSASHTYGFGDSQGEGRRFDGHTCSTLQFQILWGWGQGRHMGRGWGMVDDKRLST